MIPPASTIRISLLFNIGIDDKSKQLTIFSKSVTQTLSDIKKFNFDEMWNGVKRGELIPQISSEEATAQINKYTSAVSNSNMTSEQFFKTVGKNMPAYFRSFIASTTEAERTTQNYLQHIEKCREAQIKNGEAIEKVGLKSKLASAGMTALSMAGNMLIGMAVSTGIQLIVTGLDNIINRTQKLIEAGEQAKQTISNIGDSYNTKRDIVSANKDRYIKLSKGVDNATNQNLSLTTDQYSEFLNISNQLAQTFPSLVIGYDSQRNALLSLSGDADETTTSLENLLEQERQLSDFKISQNLQTAFDGTIARIEQLQDEIDNLNQKLSDYEGVKKALDTDNKYTLSEMGIKSDNSSYASIDLFSADADEVARDQMLRIQESFIKAANEVGLQDVILQELDSTAYNGTDLGMRWTADLSELTQEQLIDFTEAYKAALTESGIDVTEAYIDALLLKQQHAQEIQANWQSMVQTLITSISVYDGYNKLGDDIKQAINTGIGKIDPVKEWIDEDGNANTPDNIRAYLRQKFLDPITNVLNDESLSLKDKNSFQDTINSIFSLDKTTLSSQEYQTQLNSYLESIRKFFGDDEKFNDFVLAFGFKVQTENGEIIDSRDSLIKSISDRIGKNDDTSTDITSLDELTYEQLVNVEFKYTDSSNGKTLAEIIKEEISNTQKTLDSNPSIYLTLFKDSDGKQTEFGKQIDTFKENISTLSEARNALISGETVNMTDLFTNFPELTQQSDDLVESINRLKNQNLADELSSVYSKLSTSTNTEDVTAMTNYASALLSDAASQMTNADMQQVQSMLSKALIPENATTLDRQRIYGWVDSLFKNTDFSPNISSFQKLSKELNDLKVEASDFEERLSLKDDSQKTVKDYEFLIKNSKEQVRLLNESNTELQKKQQDYLKNVGASVYDSEYIDLQNQIDSNNSAIRNATKSQLEWNEAIRKIPFEVLNNKLSDLQSKSKQIQDNISLNDALGIKSSKSSYRELISNSREQVAILQKQNRLNQVNLSLLKIFGFENTSTYRDITSQIESNVSAINEARIAQLEWNKAAKELDYQPNEGLMAYNEAKQSRNAGDNYLDMLSAAEEAQKAREQGLVGTDDFKTVAKMFSPNGMDDYANWDENYGKIKRYFTEDVSGIKNFLEDLKGKTNDAGEALATFDESTKTWKYNIDDVQGSADALGISFEAFLSIMGRLQDYGFSNNFFSSVEDGQDRLGGLYSELAEAESELTRLLEERDNGNKTVTDTVLRSQEAKIESIKSSILSTQDLIDQLMNRQVSDYEAETQSALRTAQSMIEKISESDNEVTKRRIQNELESFALEYGITLRYDANTGELLGLSQSNQEILQEAMDKDPVEIKYTTPDLTNRPQVSPEKMWEADWRNVQPDEYATVYSSAYSNEDETKTVVVTPILPNGDVLDENSLRGYADQLLNGDEIDAEVHLATFEGKDSVQQANNYSDALHAVQEAYYSEDEELQSLISSLGEYNKAQLESIQLADGSYDETYAEAEKSIDNILSTLGLSTDQASALYYVLEQMGLIKPSVDMSSVDEAKEEIEGSETELPVKPKVYVPYKFDDEYDVNQPETTDTPTEIEQTVTCDAEEIDAAKEDIQELRKESEEPIVIKFIQEGIEFIQDVADSVQDLNEKSVDIDFNVGEDSLSGKIDDVNESLENMPDAESTLSADDQASEVINSVDESLQNISDVESVISADDQASDVINVVDESLRSISDAESTISADDQATDPILDVSVLLNMLDNTNPVSDLKANDLASDAINRVEEKLNQLNGKVANVTIHTTQTGNTAGGSTGDFASGTLHAPKASGTLINAHASGTAYNMLNLRPYASGTDVTIKKDEVALVNELKTEALIRNGKLYEIPGGTHLQSLKRGDIVINGEQWEQIKKYGYTNSFAGNAYAFGTIGSPLANAYASNDGKFAVSITTPSSSSSGNKDSSSSGDKTGTGSQDNKTKKDFKNVIDYVEKRLKYLADKTKSIADKITDYVSSSFKATQLKAQIESISKEIEGNNKAAERYKKEYESIDGLTKEQKKDIQEGKFDITEVKDENLRDKLQTYEEYYNKAKDCKSAVVELRNEQLKLFEDLMNMPTEKAEKKIEKLERRMKNLDSAYKTISGGGSSVSSYISTILNDSGLDKATKKQTTAYAKLEKATANKNEKKAELTTAKANLDTAKNNTKDLAKSLTTAAKKKKNNVPASVRKKISAAIKAGTTVDTKGLTGDALKAAKEYNKSVKAQNSAGNEYLQAQSAYDKANENYDSKKNAANEARNNRKSILDSLDNVQQTALKYSNDVTYKGQNAILDAKLSVTKKQNDINQNALKEADKNLADAQKAYNKANAKVKNAKTKQDKEKAQEERKIAQEKLEIAKNAQQEAQENAISSQAEYAEMVVSNEKEKFENIKGYYEATLDYEDQVRESISVSRELKQKQGKELTKDDFTKELDQIAKQRKTSVDEKNKLDKQLQDSVNKGIIKEGSEEWYRAKVDIASVDQEINKLDSDALDLKDTMREDIFYKQFEKALETTERLRKSLDTIKSLISEDMMFDSDGKLTDFGITALAMDVKNYESGLADMETLVNKRKEIEKQWRNRESTGYSEEEYKADVIKNEEALQKALTDTNSIRKSIIDTVAKQGKAELDATLKVIDARKDLLKTQKDYYDYDKTLKNKTNDLQLLEQQIRALDGVNNAEAKAQKARLEAQRKDLQDELDDTVRTHKYDIQIEGLDDLKTELQENYDNYVKDLNSNLDTIVSVVKSTTDSINGSLGTVTNSIYQLLKSFGVEGLNMGVLGIPQYASGTNNAKGGLARVNEKGNEIIFLEDGSVLLPLTQGSTVKNAAITESILNNLTDYPKMTLPKMNIPDVKIQPRSGGNVYNYSYDSLIRVDGNVDKYVVDDLSKLGKDLLQDRNFMQGTYKYTSKEIWKDLRK